METSTDTGTKRKREEEHCSSSSARISPTNIQDLMGDGFHHAMRYLKHPDRLVLATTCKAINTAVEDYCRLAIAKIMKDHVVDDSFEERLVEYFAAKVGDTKRGHPGQQVNIPQRCRLYSAHGVHLCALKMPSGDQGIHCGLEMAISKDNSILAVAELVEKKHAGIRVHLHLWQLSNKTLLRTVEYARIEREYFLRRVYWIEGRVVICTSERLLVISSNTGETIHECRHRYILTSAQKDETTLIFSDEASVFSFDIISGMKQSIAQGHFQICGVYQNRWLVAHHQRTRLDQRTRLATFDLQKECSKVYKIRDGNRFWTMLGQHKSNVIYAMGESSLTVFEVDEKGQLSRTHNHPINPSVPSGSNCRMVGSTFFKGRHGTMTAQDLDSKSSGLRYIHFPKECGLAYCGGRIQSNHGCTEIFMFVESFPLRRVVKLLGVYLAYSYL